MKKSLYCFMAAIVICIWGMFPVAGHAARFKVLVVMSYEETFPGNQAIKKGIDPVLAAEHEIKYFYMDTKKNLECGPQKAGEAYALYKEFQPDGVIAADDNAQSMFVVKYLKDKVRTPVMFCGVNADPGKYGYPSSNVSGILERLHISETIALARQMAPSIETVGFIMKDSPVAKIILQQINSESDTYPAKSVGLKMPKTLKQAVSMTEELKKQCDLLFMVALQGISDEDGKPVSEKEAVSTLTGVFAGPSITCLEYNVRYGVLCAVIHRMKEQGETAAKMLLKAMQGMPVTEIPITRNYNGKRVINVTVLKALGIRPRADFLLGAELVKTEK